MAIAAEEVKSVGRRKWLLVFLFVNIIGLGVIIWGVMFRQIQLDDMQIVKCTPRAEVVREDIREVILAFDKELDPQTVMEGTVCLSPKVEGELELVGKQEMRFVLREPLKRATRYHVEVARSLRGRRGESLGEYNCEFNTSPLTVEKIVQGSVDVHGGINLKIVFNAKVDPRDLTQALALKYKNNHVPDFRVLGNSASECLQVQITDFQYDTVLLAIKQGLVSIEGPLALAKPYHATVKMLDAQQSSVISSGETDKKTINTTEDEPVVYVSQQVRFLGLKAYSASDSGRIDIEANAPFDVAEARKYIAIEPVVAYSFESRHTGLALVGEFEAGKRYRVTLQKGLPAGIAGVLNETVSRSVWFSDREEDIAFTYGGGYLSPNGLLLFPVKAVNVKDAELTVSKLFPENIVEYVLTGEDSVSSARARELKRHDLHFSATNNEYEEKILDLREVVEDDPLGVYSLTLRNMQNHWDNAVAVVAVSDMGITSRVTNDSVLCWVTSLSTAEPLANAQVTLYSDRRQKLGSAVTDADGLCRIIYGNLPADEVAAVLVVQQGRDISFLGLNRNQRRRGTDAATGRPYLNQGYEAYIATERGVYRPGDTVHVTSLVRNKEVKAVANIPLELMVRRPDGKEIIHKLVTCDLQGRISVDIEIPQSSVTGYYEVSVTIPSGQTSIGSGGFRVEDYIPQTLSMNLSPVDSEQFPAVEQKLRLNAVVKHLFGQPAAGLKITGKIECCPELFKPADWEGYVFTPEVLGNQILKATFPEKILDIEGKAEFELSCLVPDNAPVVRETVEVTVYEKGGRSLSESHEQKFYPWEFYLGIKSPTGKIEPQQSVVFDLAVVGCDGKAYNREVAWEAELYAVNWTNVLRRQDSGQIVFDWSRKETFVERFEGSGKGEQEIQLKPEYSGHYILKVRAKGSYTVLADFFVTGKDDTTLVKQDPDVLKLLPDRKIYSLGQTASVSVQAPFAGTALVCIEGDEIIESRVVSLQKGLNRLDFEVDASWRPNAFVSVTLVRAVEATEKWLPHRASGVARLAVDCSDKKLQVDIQAPETVRPGQEASFRIHVNKEDGAAATNTAVVFAAVDMGVLGLDDFVLEEPWDFFYSQRRLDVQEADMYSRLAPEMIAWRVQAEASPGGGGQYEDNAVSRRLSPIKAKRVKTAVLYAGSLITDVNGDVVVDFIMPEYIGELKLMVLAAAGDSFGSAEKPLQVKSPLMYRASWPRFLAPDDEFTVTLNIFNNTGVEGEVTLDLSDIENLILLNPGVKSLVVKNGESQSLELHFKAGSIGVAKARLKVALAGEMFAQSVELPVRPAALLSRHSELLKVEPGETLRGEVDGNFLAGSFNGNLMVTGNPVAGVSGQINYLLRYPYGCLEQTVSSMLPLIYMPDLARIISPETVGEEEVETLLEAGMQRLLVMQTWSGGLAMWPGGKQVHSWATVYAVDFMLEAQKAGYNVPADLLSGALTYISEHIDDWVVSTDATGIYDQQDVAAYAAYVLCRAGKPPHSWLASLEEHLQQNVSHDKIENVTARCYLAAAYLCCGEIQAAQELLTALPSIVAVRNPDMTFNSPQREQAILLTTLLDVKPESARIPQLVASLRVNCSDPWQISTQENAFVLQALGKYARKAVIDPEAEATVILNGNTEVFKAVVGRAFVLDESSMSWVVANNSKMPLYVYTFYEGIPNDNNVKERDEGISVRRYITDIGNNTIQGELKQGRLYRIHLEIKAPRDINDIVIVDMLAAGLEIENQDLKGGGILDTTYQQQRLVLANIEKRDDRIILFANVPEGKSSYSYVVRAVSPGKYSWPACDASAMYDPAVFSVNGNRMLEVAK